MALGRAPGRTAMKAVTIDRIAGGGDGVGRLSDGMTVFVPRTAPNDVAEIEIVSRKRRFAHGRLVRLERAGTGRVEPPCPHYRDDACGGCHLQHLTYEDQVAAKRRIVEDAVTRIGGRDPGEISVLPADRPWRYRSRVTITVGDGGHRLGFHRFDRPGEVFDLRDCLIAREPLMELWGRIRQHRRHLPPGSESVSLREDRGGGRHVIVAGGRPPVDLTRLASAVAAPDVAYWWAPRGGAARVVRDAETGSVGHGYPALAFEQSNRAFADRIRGDAVTALRAMPDDVVWDLYGGVGDAARQLAESGARVWSVDSDRRAIAWATSRPHPRAPSQRPNYLAAPVEEALTRLPAPSRVLLNPPRTGAGRRVADHLNRLAAAGALRRVVYVSCDPATLARDLARLPALALRHLAAYDLFPQTSHVESLAVLEAA